MPSLASDIKGCLRVGWQPLLCMLILYGAEGVILLSANTDSLVGLANRNDPASVALASAGEAALAVLDFLLFCWLLGKLLVNEFGLPSKIGAGTYARHVVFQQLASGLLTLLVVGIFVGVTFVLAMKLVFPMISAYMASGSASYQVLIPVMATTMWLTLAPPLWAGLCIYLGYAPALIRHSPDRFWMRLSEAFASTANNSAHHIVRNMATKAVLAATIIVIIPMILGTQIDGVPLAPPAVGAAAWPVSLISLNLAMSVLLIRFLRKLQEPDATHNKQAI